MSWHSPASKKILISGIKLLRTSWILWQPIAPERWYHALPVCGSFPFFQVFPPFLACLRVILHRLDENYCTCIRYFLPVSRLRDITQIFMHKCLRHMYSVDFFAGNRSELRRTTVEFVLRLFEINLLSLRIPLDPQPSLVSALIFIRAQFRFVYQFTTKGLPASWDVA